MHTDFDFYKGMNDATFSSLLPPQAIPDSEKTPEWAEATMNSLASIARRQVANNIYFRDYYKMCNGDFTYSGTSFGEFNKDSFFVQEIKKITENNSIPSFVRHYDFLGMLVNCLVGMYEEFQDIFRVTSYDEHSTSEYIRERTELIKSYANRKLEEELTKMLIQQGIDPNKQDFQSEEEQQAYQQEIQQRKQELTPDEIDDFMKKNFKVIATEWAENCLKVDREEMQSEEIEREQFRDFLLTGRFFTHFRVMHDTYKSERWNVEETFFSQDADAKYPQDGEYVGRQRRISPSKIIDLYGHLLTTEEQESISNYFNQDKKNYTSRTSSDNWSKESIIKKGFGENRIVPFQNYYEHNLLKNFESTFDLPLATRTVLDGDGNERSYTDWLPDYGDNQTQGNFLSKYMRDDIDVRTDTVEVTEAYWRSYKRTGLLTYRNSQGLLSQVIVTDDLMNGYLKEYGIKKLKKVTLEEIIKAKDNGKLAEYENTIVYQYTPQIWSGVKIKANGNNLQKDIYLNLQPLPYQIKGRSNRYDAPLPVCGIISNGIAKKIAPFQILANIVMNQGTDMLEREVGTFLVYDINYLPSEFKEDMDNADAIANIMELARTTGMLQIDMSKQNTAGNQPVNSIQKQSLTYGAEVMQKVQLYQMYKQMGYEQIGITAQMMGAPTAYTTAEGVKQGQNAVYAQITPLFDTMNNAKVQVMNTHLAIAQWCKANGKDNTLLTAGSDGEHYFIDILKEDPDLFALRDLKVGVTTNGRDRKVLEQMKQFIMNDNTITRNLHDVFSIFSNPTLIGMKQIALENKKEIQAQRQEDMKHQQDLLDKQIQANETLMEKEFQRKKEIEDNKNETAIEVKTIDAIARGNAKDFNVDTTEAIIDEKEKALNNVFTKFALDQKQEVIDNNKEAQNHKMKIDMIKLGQQAEALRLKEKAIDTTKFNSLVNKN